ncbi:MAG: type I-E CRISPR-associated protein Cse1/CasA, partial [Thermoguttaceae bacterium]
RLDGRFERVGIRVVLTEAARIRQLAATNPMDNVALLRFLLAVVYWCKGVPPIPDERDQILADSGFPSEWLSRLEEHRDCFNLLGDGERFYQNSAYKGRSPEHTSDYLIHEVPSGTNKWLFRHATDHVDGLCRACCAMGLVRLPVFATSAGKGMSASTGKSFGINSKPPLYVIPVGTSLANTLLFSWQTPTCELGTPAWECPGGKLPSSGEVPLLTGLTWLPRSVWLANPEESKSTCISCGRKDRVIRHCVFDGKGSSKTESRVWRDPHVIYETSKTGKVSTIQTSNALDSENAAAGNWASCLAAILRGQKVCKEATLWIVGFSTVQNDKYLEATEWCLSFLDSSENHQELVAKLDQWKKEGATLADQVRRNASSRNRTVEIPPAIDAIRPDIEARVCRNVGELLGGDPAAWDRAAQEYKPLMDVVAMSLSPGFTTQAVERRKQIAGVLPRMNLGVKSDKRKGKKGSRK